jgi:hypothetical protein
MLGHEEHIFKKRKRERVSKSHHMRFGVFKAVKMLMLVFWVVMSCVLVGRWSMFL